MSQLLRMQMEEERKFDEVKRRLDLLETIQKSVDVHTLNALQTAINSLKFNPKLEDANVQSAEYRLCALRDVLGNLID